MLPICDLHTHSVFSDGTLTPTALVREAKRIGLSAVALCDHNTADGLPEFLAAAKGTGVEAVAGAEFSVDLDGQELHLLGLFLPPSSFADITALMADVSARKEESNLALIHSLAKAGYPLDYEAIKAKTPNGRINRAHIAAAMTEAGYTASVAMAFATLLSPAAGHYKEPKRLTLWETLDFLREARAVPVLAHPYLNLTPTALARLLPRAKRAGLVGMECLYSLYDEQTEMAASAAIRDAGLLPSGGSDFHGTVKPDIALGFGKGNLRIPYAWCAALRESVGK